MSDKYDNWEKLVDAVLLREELKQIALSDSREPSSINTSRSSRFSSTFRDDDQLNVYNNRKEKSNLQKIVMKLLMTKNKYRLEAMRVAASQPGC
ncbi:hypothetical protein CDL12_05531 [Handroanthus impetiginosus]|uniref:Non-specific serine/threonine protein kinase n=1 Tax=Handroanthus impetiginosus TaxID=429701 RepID=A0A2G9HW62_9LAMI|nr:hypothetical protein CDL12_05531 [Handroanthus impetiginosus]